MAKLKSFFRNPLVVALLGLTALALLVWFVGPLIAVAGYEPLFSTTARLVTILLIVVLWGVHQARKRMREQRANAEIAKGLSTGESADAVPQAAAARAPAREDEVAVLRQRFTEALELLKKSRKAQGGGLYALPWYVIIGPPGAGKTTALKNSGLRFPLADRFGDQALRGVGGTRNCDWWFTDDAILLDTAGRYLTQDSDPDADSEAWKGFLGLIKKYRPRRPLNGVLVAISLSDLLVQSPAERAAHVRAVRQRVDELYAYFKVRFPVYVLLTKADLVAGFGEFFEDLGKDGREQVWGFTLPLEDQEAVPDLEARVQTEYDALVQRLSERMLTRLEQERDPARRALIFGFPGQMALLRGALVEFLTGCFRGNQFETPLLLRGVYLTSGTQEGTPIDRLLGSVARGFGLAPGAVSPGRGPGRSYFITDLLRRVIFPEADLAGTNRRLERLRAWGQRGAYAAAAAAVLLAGLAWTMSYRTNRAHVDEVSRQADALQKAVAGLPATDMDLLAVLPVLDAARALPGGYADRDASRPWSAGFGLYQGNRLGRAAQDTYQRLLRDLFAPRVLNRVEGQLRSAPNDSDFLMEALRVYRMLGEGQHVEPEAVQAWVELDWDTNLTSRLSADDRRHLGEHLAALLEQPLEPARVPLDGALIRQAQRNLRAAPLAERAYSRLKRRSAGGLAPFTIASAAGPDAALVFARRSGAPLTDGIPPLFTRAGYDQIFLPGSKELRQQVAEQDWVLEDAGAPGAAASHTEPGALEDAVLKLYLNDYGRQYEDLLADVTVVPVRDMDQTVTVLQILSGPQSPLLLLLQAVAQETAFGTDAKPAGTDDGKAAGAIDAAKNRLREMLGTATGGVATQVSAGASTIEEFAKTRFGSLREQVTAPEGGKAPFSGVLDLLNELYVLLDSVRKNPNAAKALTEGSRQLDAIVGKLDREAQRQPKAVQNVVAQVAGATKSVSSGNVRAHLNATWRNPGLAFCRQAIANRYPIARGAATEISLQDFATFFGPGGIADAFFEANLADLVDTSRDPWQWRPGGGMANASPGALMQFQRARKIRDTFFPGGAKTPTVTFELTPLTMDTSITNFVLDIEGKQVTYDHGPAVPTTITWPGQGPRQVRVDMAPPSGSGPSGITESGAWDWFRLLDRSRIEASGVREQFDVTFSVGGRSARFRLAATSASNPFGSDMLRGFRCPEEL
jgi:type VI secretion system protein ImpL